MCRDYETNIQDDAILNEAHEKLSKIDYHQDGLDVRLWYLSSRLTCKSVSDTEIVNICSKIILPTKLPDIPLPLFSGKIRFSTFKNQFIITIVDNVNLSVIPAYFFLNMFKRRDKNVETS